MDRSRIPEVGDEHPEAGRLLASVLGEAPPVAPVEAMWADLRAQLPGVPRARLLRLPALVAAAAAILVLAAVLLLGRGDADSERLRLRVLDVPEEQESRPLSREEAAEIFYGTEAPVLLGSDTAAGVPTGG